MTRPGRESLQTRRGAPQVNPGSAFGGTGESGCGREMGFAAMAEYTTQKSVGISVDAALPDSHEQ